MHVALVACSTITRTLPAPFMQVRSKHGVPNQSLAARENRTIGTLEPGMDRDLAFTSSRRRRRSKAVLLLLLILVVLGAGSRTTPSHTTTTYTSNATCTCMMGAVEEEWSTSS